MKILITSTGSYGTGSFTVIDGIVPELLKLGHEVKVLFPDHNDSIDPKYNSDIFEVWKFPIEADGERLENFPLMISDPHPRNPNPCIFKNLSEGQLNLYFSSFEEKLKQVISNFQPDIIESQHIWAMAYVISQLDIPYICVAHHSDQMGFEFDERMRPYAIKAAQKAEKIFAISEPVREKVSKLYDLPQENIVTISNGYDKNVFYKQPEKNNSDGLKYVSFSGKLSRTKGFDVLLEAINLLDDNKLHFLIYGAGDQKEFTTENKKNVHFFGHQPPEVIAKAHNKCHLSVMPSRTEGFGIAGLEAMACGLPLVTTKSGGPESFAVGEIIETENPEALADAIKRMVNLSEEEYQSLSSQAIKKANEFSWKKITAERIKYYL